MLQLPLAIEAAEEREAVEQATLAPVWVSLPVTPTLSSIREAWQFRPARRLVWYASRATSDKVGNRPKV